MENGKKSDNQPDSPLEGEVVEKPSLPAVEESDVVAKPAAAEKNIFIGTLNLIASPAKALAHPVKRHYRRKYHGKYRHAKKLFIFDLVLVGVAAALLAASLYFFFSKHSPSPLRASVKEGPQFAPGQTQELTLQFANESSSHLVNLNIVFDFPEEIVLKKFPDGFNPQNNSFFADILKEKQTLSLPFAIQPWGAAGERMKILARANFTGSKNQKPTEQIISSEIILNRPSVKTAWTMPDSVFLGEDFSLTAVLNNESDENFLKIIVLPSLPADFEIISANPELQNGRWVLENLKAKEARRISLNGFFRSLPKNGILSLALQTSLENGQKQYPQEYLIGSVKIENHQFNLSAKIETEKKYLKPGEEAFLSVFYRNQSKETVKKASFSLSSPSLPSGQKNKKTVEEIKPGEEGKIKFDFSLPADLSGLAGLEKNPSVVLLSEAFFSFKNSPEKTFRAFAPPLAVKISSLARLHSQARYFTDEGDQVGRGPLPPRVGQTTKYWVNWFATSFPNDLNEVKITGSLPAGVLWTGRTNVTEGETVKFDPVTRQIFWQNDFIKATPGGRCPCVGVSFEISVTPTAADAGREIILLENQQIQAQDSLTGENIIYAAPDVASNLTADNFAKGKGIVQP